jgi:hypothetical protein
MFQNGSSRLAESCSACARATLQKIKVGHMRPGHLAERGRIETEARKLAHSGQHSGWRSIERALMSRGTFCQVSYVFRNAWTRSELNRLCQQAQLQRKERA